MKHLIYILVFSLFISTASEAAKKTKRSKRAIKKASVSKVQSKPSKVEDVTNKFNSLGANDEIIERAKALDPENRVRVVQNRAVDRTLRFEIGGNFGMVAGGDPYVNTQNFGAHLDFHINPRWSLGARYYKSNNSLTSEGQRRYDEAQATYNETGQFRNVPDIDYAEHTYLGVINWYPIYGKFNLFDMGVVQFDFYALAGAGQVQLSSGSTPTYTAGTGVGLWFSKHISSRIEARWQTYQDEVYTGSRNLNIFVGTVGLGILL